MLVLLLVSGAMAVEMPFFVSGYEATDNATSTAIDSLEFQEVLGGGAVDADIRLVNQTGSPPTAHTHNENNGADSTSKWALQVDVTGSEVAYYKLPRILSGSAATISVGLSLHLDTAPSSNRTILAFVDQTGGLSCSVQLRTDRKLDLVLGTGYEADGTSTVIGTSSETIAKEGVCNDNPAVTCTTGSDCAGGSCTASCASGGSGCWWPAIELVEINQSPAISCELWVNGRRSVATALPTKVLGLDPIYDVYVGALCGASGTCKKGDPAQSLPAESGTLKMWFDDFVLSSTERAGFGWVSKVTPNADLGTTEWTVHGTCTGGNYGCVNSYGTSPYSYDDTNYLRVVGSKYRAVQFSSTTPTLTIPAGGSITGVDIVATGRTGSVYTGVRSFQLGALDCDSTTSCLGQKLKTCVIDPDCWGSNGTNPDNKASNATCDSTTKVCKFLMHGYCDAACSNANAPCALDSNCTGCGSTKCSGNPPQMHDRFMLLKNVANNKWDSDTLSRLGLMFQITPVNNERLETVELIAYVRMRRSDGSLPVILKDHNAGTDDGKIAIYCKGDSTGGGVAAVTCVYGTNAGNPCAVDYSCNWDPYRALPSGGCSTNGQCQTCAGNSYHVKDSMNGGAGYPCGPNAGGQSCNLGTCSGGTCTGDTTVSCGVDADCDLGLCDTCSNADCTSQSPTSTCLDSCPGTGPGGIAAYCPITRLSWCDGIATGVGADYVINCPLQGESTYGGAVALMGSGGIISNGTSSYCSAIKGTGICTCDPAKSQCGSGGTCSGGVCTAGAGTSCTADDNCLWCSTNSDCSSGTCVGGKCSQSNSTCKFPLPDYIVWMEGYNDTSDVGYAPNCTGPNSVQLGMGDPYLGACAPSSITRCNKNADCSGIASDSECVGYGAASTGGYNNYPCVADRAFGACTEKSQLCKVTADCALGTCTTNDPTANFAAGICQCSGSTNANADAQCPTGSACVGWTSSVTECGSTATCTCRLKCTSTNDCGAVGSSCVNRGDGQNVCQGMCTAPSDAKTCTRDADCPGHQYSYIAPNRKWQGVCVSGHCSCTGNASGPSYCVGESTPTNCGDAQDGKCSASRLACSCDADCQTTASCFEQYNQYHAFLSDWTMGNFEKVQRYITGLNDSTPPKLIISTIPILNTTVIDSGPNSKDAGQLMQVNEQIIAQYSPYVVDMNRALSAYPTVMTHSDFVHLNAAGAQVGGMQVQDTFNTFGACSVGQCLLSGETQGASCDTSGVCVGGRVCVFGPFASPKRYCHAINGSWPSSGCIEDATSCTCTSNSGCSPIQRCEPKPCTGSSDCPGSGDACNLEQ